MTKKERQKLEDQKPFDQQNYWKLSKSGKDLWLNKKGATKSEHVIIPLLIPLIGVAVFLLGLILLILAIIFPNGIFGGPAMIAACSVVMAIGVGVFIWMLINMKKNCTGLFINQYNSGDRNAIERAHESIEEEEQISGDMTSSSSDLDAADLGL